MSTQARLDSVCEIVMGQAPDGAAYNLEGRGWPLVAGAGDFGDGYPSVKKYTTQASKLSQRGDIVLSIRASIGQKVLADGEYCLGRGVAGLRPRPQLDAGYLWHWLDSTQKQLAAKAKGATFKQVNRQDIGELPITLPALEAQQRIAKFLDRADRLRAKRRATLSLLDSLTSAVFMEMFGEPSPDWPVTTVAGLTSSASGSIRTGPFGSQLLHSEFVTSGIAVLGIDNAVRNEFAWSGLRFISENKYRQLARYTVYPGDVLITIMGTLGRCAVVPDDIPPRDLDETPLLHHAESREVPTGLPAGIFPPSSGRAPISGADRQRGDHVRLEYGDHQRDAGRCTSHRFAEGVFASGGAKRSAETQAARIGGGLAGALRLPPAPGVQRRAVMAETDPRRAENGCRETAMGLTRDFKYSVIARVQRDPKFAKALLDEAATQFLNGEPETARLILRDPVNATVGFEGLAQKTQMPSKSLHRMLSERGNPSMDNLAAIFDAVRNQLKVGVTVRAVAT